MTYKHIDFGSSIVMRSLEKVAVEKGLIKPSSMTKIASNSINLSPSSNLIDNVMRLCAGLRKSGLEKYALDIENKFVSFKQAASLYDTHGEKGEDLVDAAHPDGSHKMEGLDNAIFKTIVDKHLDIVNMVNKKPTGKLSNANDILRAVKIVLAQEAQSSNLTEDQLNPLRAVKAIDQLKSILDILNKCKSTVINKMTTTTLARSFDKNYNEISAEIGLIDRDSPSAFILRQIKAVLGDLADIQKSINFFNWSDLSTYIPVVGPLVNLLRHSGDIVDIATGDWETGLRDKISSFITEAEGVANKARSYILGELDNEIIHEDEAEKQKQRQQQQRKQILNEMTNTGNKIANLMSKLMTWKTNANVIQHKEVIGWIDKEITITNNCYTDYSKISELIVEFKLSDAQSKLLDLQAKVNNEESDIKKFETDWASYLK